MSLRSSDTPGRSEPRAQKNTGRNESLPRASTRATPRPRSVNPTDAERVLGTEDASLLDIVDNVLSKGVVLTGDVMIGLAQVDLVYARVSLLLSAADRVLPGEDPEPIARYEARHAARVRARRAAAGRAR